jgi:hypothetical protein
VKGKLVSEVVEKNVSDEAQKAFKAKYDQQPEAVLGPFYRKRMGVLNSQTEVRFAGPSKKAIFNDWYVNAMLLMKPEKCVWIFFNTRVDGRKMPKPENLIVKEEEVQFLSPEQEKAMSSSPPPAS